MRSQHFNLVLRPHFGSVEVGVEIAGAFAIHRRAVVIRGGGIGCAGRRNNLHADRRAIEFAK